jgi:hypothetical protein
VYSVIQEEEAGCGIASVANIVGQSYNDVKVRANSLGIYAQDDSLYSYTSYVRKLLSEYGVTVSAEETPFKSWIQVPDFALLSTKYHEENGSPFWHWVVFKRINGSPMV